MGLFDWWKNRSRASGHASHDEAARSFGFYPELQLSNEPGWLPETVDGDGPPRGSRIGGHAFLLAGEAHPACGVCGAPLHLVVQLNSGELPEPMSAWTGPGIFQVFCCLSECSAEADGRAPSSRVHLTRRIDLDAAGELASAGRSVSAKAITGWHPIDDVPLWRETPLEITEEMEEHYEFSEGPFEGDKLGGWPTWVHGPEYQHCRRCGAKMRVLFQVGSHFNVIFQAVGGERVLLGRFMTALVPLTLGAMYRSYSKLDDVHRRVETRVDSDGVHHRTGGSSSVIAFTDIARVRWTKHVVLLFLATGTWPQCSREASTTSGCQLLSSAPPRTASKPSRATRTASTRSWSSFVAHPQRYSIQRKFGLIQLIRANDHGPPKRWCATAQSAMAAL